MKTSLTVLVLVLLLSILVGCAPGPNPSRKMASEHGEFAGFGLGLWQGFIAPFVFVVSLFKGDLNVYEVDNNGSWYNFGYLFGRCATSMRAGGWPKKRLWSRLNWLGPNLERCAGSINPFYEHSFFRCSQSKLLLVLKRNHGREGTEMMMQG